MERNIRLAPGFSFGGQKEEMAKTDMEERINALLPAEEGDAAIQSLLPDATFEAHTDTQQQSNRIDDASSGAHGAAASNTGGYTNAGELEKLKDEIEKYSANDEITSVLHGSRDGLRDRLESVESRLRQTELECVQEYASQSESLSQLQHDVQSCDTSLSELEGILGSFQQRLGQLASEIKSLQESSQSMSMRLHNRKQAEAELSTVVDNLTVPPELSKGLLECDVESEQYSQLLKKLGEKLDCIERESASDSPPLALERAKPQLEKLRSKAGYRCRDSLLSRIATLKKPRTNVQIVQQNVLAPLSPIARFMCKHTPSLYADIKNAYCTASSKVLKQSLASYATALYKKKTSVLARNELLGTKPLDANPVPEQFRLGKRAEVLSDSGVSSPVIVSQLEASNNDLGWEEAFRSAHTVLVDCATSEFLFCNEFWAESSVEMFDAAFSGALSQVEHATSKEVSACHDPIALLLAAKVIRSHQLVMARRAIPALDRYHDRIALLLWPRIKKLLEDNAKSLESLGARSVQLESVCTAHPAIKRYAELAASVDILNSGSEDHLEVVCERLRNAAWALVERVGNTISRTALEKEAYKAANAYEVRSAFQRESATVAQYVGSSASVPSPGQAGSSSALSARSSNSSTPAPQSSTSAADMSSASTTNASSANAGDSAVATFFESKIESAIDTIADSEARRCMSEIVGAVESIEQRSKPNDSLLANASDALEAFAKRWRKALNEVDASVRSAVGGGELGKEAAQKALSKALGWYARLAGQGGLLERMGERGRSVVSKDAVGQAAILGEVKRLTQPQ